MAPRKPIATLGDPRTRQAFRRRLLRWYARSARDLPWRRTHDPYAIWVSEIMLQQTQVAAVVPYFERFLAAFPTVSELACATEHDVLRLWEGLGYYSRARNLHRAAHQVDRNYGGRVPDDPKQLADLPGIGRYTAGAIASIAFDRRTPILEANTRRVLSRLAALREDPRTATAERRLWQFADRILPRSRPGRFNQALMELGAEVCRPRDPACGRCPVHLHCRAYRAGLQHALPLPGRPTKVQRVREAAVVVRRGRR
ncbi:MAG: A/G-specific adenine glycosylase, partial [Pirellulales bacterium]